MTQIVQIAPSIGPGSGVAGVAYALEREFIAAGATVERFTAADAGRYSAGTASTWDATSRTVAMASTAVPGTQGAAHGVTHRAAPQKLPAATSQRTRSGPVAPP